MDVSDVSLYNNRDWDPSYLAGIFTQDFYEFKDLWNNSNVNDVELVQASQVVENVGKYEPIVEDISLDDETLCSAVEQIESE